MPGRGLHEVTASVVGGRRAKRRDDRPLRRLLPPHVGQPPPAGERRPVGARRPPRLLRPPRARRRPALLPRRRRRRRHGGPPAGRGDPFERDDPRRRRPSRPRNVAGDLPRRAQDLAAPALARRPRLRRVSAVRRLLPAAALAGLAPSRRGAGRRRAPPARRARPSLLPFAGRRRRARLRPPHPRDVGRDEPPSGDPPPARARRDEAAVRAHRALRRGRRAGRRPRLLGGTPRPGQRRHPVDVLRRRRQRRPGRDGHPGVPRRRAGEGADRPRPRRPRGLLAGGARGAGRRPPEPDAFRRARRRRRPDGRLPGAALVPLVPGLRLCRRRRALGRRRGPRALVRALASLSPPEREEPLRRRPPRPGRRQRSRLDRVLPVPQRTPRQRDAGLHRRARDSPDALRAPRRTTPRATRSRRGSLPTSGTSSFASSRPASSSTRRSERSAPRAPRASSASPSARGRGRSTGPASREPRAPDGTRAFLDARADAAANRVDLAFEGTVRIRLDLPAAGLDAARSLSLRLSGGPRLDLALAGPFAPALVATLDGAPVVLRADDGGGAPLRPRSAPVRLAPRRLARARRTGRRDGPARPRAGPGGGGERGEVRDGPHRREPLGERAPSRSASPRRFLGAVPALGSRPLEPGVRFGRSPRHAPSRPVASPLRLRVVAGDARAVAASARVFNTTAIGTYGLSFPVFPAAGSVLGSGETALLFGPGDPRRRADERLALRAVRSLGGRGHRPRRRRLPLRSLRVDLAGLRRAQLDDVLAGAGRGARSVRVTVLAGRVQVYGTAISNSLDERPVANPRPSARGRRVRVDRSGGRLGAGTERGVLPERPLPLRPGRGDARRDASPARRQPARDGTARARSGESSASSPTSSPLSSLPRRPGPARSFSRRPRGCSPWP